MSDTENKENEISTEVESQENDNKIDFVRADNTLGFIDDHEEEFKDVVLTEREESVLTRKINTHLLPLAIAVNTLLYMDKATLSYSSILGLFETTNIGNEEYDDLNSIFYAGYVLGQSLNLVLQRHDLSRFLVVILAFWTVIIFLHTAAYNFAGLVVLRFFLGFAESIVLPLLEITFLQFYTPKQRASIQPIFYVGCVGCPVIIAGFISYGVLHVSSSIPPWRIFMMINGGITFVMTFVIAYWYPSDPSTAKFLTIKERYFLIKRVQKASGAAITQHVVKRYQVIECLKDPITWLFALFSFLLMLSNNLAYQQNLLYVSLGVSNLGSTLVSVAGGGFASLFALFGSILIYYFPDTSFWMCLLGCLPSLVTGIAMVTLPWSNKLGLLACLVLGSNTFFLAYIVGFGWATATASGNTKRYIRHLVFNVSYGISNIISPQLWKGNQTVRYYAAWSVQIVLAWFCTPIVAGIITLILKRRNKERRQYIADHPEELYGTVFKVNENGETVSEKVDIANLDLTDLENKTFIYPL